MSNAQMRSDIAAALSQVDGIAGHPSRPSAMSEGDAWPQWRGAVPRAGAFENTWDVLVVLPAADDVTADKFADLHGEALCEALRPLFYVTGISPATIPIEGSTVGLYALLLTGRSE